MKKNKPKLSICICTYNRLALLRLTIFRIIQELKGLAFEIIVVDGGSKDGTIEFLESNKLKKKVSIVLIKQKKLIGATKSYIVGFEKSKGDYVFPLPDHTLIHGRPFIESIRILDNQPQIGGVIQKFRITKHPRRNPYAIYDKKLDNFIIEEQIIYRKSIISYINSDYHTHYWACDLMLKALIQGWTICKTKKLACEHITIGRSDALHKNISQNLISSNDKKLFLKKWKYLSKKIHNQQTFLNLFRNNFYSFILSLLVKLVNSKYYFAYVKFANKKNINFIKSFVPNKFSYSLPNCFDDFIDFGFKNIFYENFFDFIYEKNSFIVQKSLKKNFYFFQKFPKDFIKK